MVYSPQGHKELDKIKVTLHTCMLKTLLDKLGILTLKEKKSF